MPSLKGDIIHLLKSKEYDVLIRLSSTKNKILNILISLSYDKGNVISWRAMESIGIITKEISKSNPVFVRNLIGRLLWMIRDESGGIGWSAPEIIGEITRNNPELCSDIALVIPSFHEEKMLTAGVLRAIGRIGKRSIEMVSDALPIVCSYLRDSDPVIRGLAVWALGEIGTPETINELEGLKSDTSIIYLYDEGELKKRIISDVAQEAIGKLNRKDQ